MKKSLLLLALALQANAEPSYTNLGERIRGADIEMLVPYKHPKAKEVGDLMPYPLGELVTSLELYVLNSGKIKGAKRLVGIIYGLDRNGDGVPEYEYIHRICDEYKEEKIYAVYDAPHKLLYIDSSRNKHVDLIAELDSILGATLPMIPTKCEQEKKVE